MDSPHKGPVMQEEFTYHDIIEDISDLPERQVGSRMITNVCHGGQLTHWPSGQAAVILKMYFSNSFYELKTRAPGKYC